MRFHPYAVGALGAVVVAGAAFAAGTETWEFDETTEGEDVSWTSPTAVDIDAPRYDLAYEITLLEVTVTWLIFQFTIDQTENIPPEFRSGSAIVDGPPPLVLFSDRVVFPAPPEEPGFEADVDIRIDGAGFGQFAMTNVFLGEVTVEIPGFGEQTVQLDAIRIAGRIEVTELGPASDINGDGVVDFADILEVLTAWGNCPEPPDPCPADVNGDGVVDFADILEILVDWS